MKKYAKKLAVIAASALSLLCNVQQVFAAAGDVSLAPATVTVVNNANFALQVRADSGASRVGSMDLDFTFDPAHLQVITDGVVAGTDGAAFDGFIPNVNNTNGTISLVAFDVVGLSPGTNLHLATITFTAIAAVSPTVVGLTAAGFTDEVGTTIGTPNGTGSTVTITAATANASIAPSALNFTVQPNVTSTAQTATLLNTGTANLTVSAIAINQAAGNGTFNLASGSTCQAGATSLAPGGSCIVNVSFTGASSNATKIATLDVTTNDPDNGGVVSVALTGNTIVAVAATAVPTLSEWVMLLLGSSILIIGSVALRRA